MTKENITKKQAIEAKEILVKWCKQNGASECPDYYDLKRNRTEYLVLLALEDDFFLG